MPKLSLLREALLSELQSNLKKLLGYEAAIKLVTYLATWLGMGNASEEEGEREKSARKEREREMGDTEAESGSRLVA